MANPYETLGVAPNASQDDIRKAYRKAAKETHPDLNPGKPEAENRFKEINAAYDIIGDADKRKRYDAGEIDETGAERRPERAAAAAPISITTSSPISSVDAAKAAISACRRRTSATRLRSTFSMR